MKTSKPENLAYNHLYYYYYHYRYYYYHHIIIILIIIRRRTQTPTKENKDGFLTYQIRLTTCQVEWE